MDIAKANFYYYDLFEFLTFMTVINFSSIKHQKGVMLVTLNYSITFLLLDVLEIYIMTGAIVYALGEAGVRLFIPTQTVV